MINFVFVSPNFPARYFKWVESLAARGIRVLGIGDSPYNELNPRLIGALTEYYFTPDLGDYPAMEKAVAYFENKYGHIDYIESDNEWWLEQDARLRERFNVSTGFHPNDMRKIKAKSAMKEYFQKAGAKTMRYLVVKGKEDKEKAIAFQKEVGFANNWVNDSNLFTEFVRKYKAGYENGHGLTVAVTYNDEQVYTQRLALGFDSSSLSEINFSKTEIEF